MMQPQPQGHDPLQLLALAMALAQAMHQQPPQAGHQAPPGHQQAPPGVPTFGKPFPELVLPKSIHGSPDGKRAPVRIDRPPAGMGRPATGHHLEGLVRRLVASPRVPKSIHGSPSGTHAPVRINGGLP